MTIDFQAVKDSRHKKEIISKCALDSFIAATQEINSILMILKNEGITPNEFIKYVEDSSGRLDAPLLQKLAKLHGGNLLAMSEQLEKDLAKQTPLSREELKELGRKERGLSADYFAKCDPIIIQKMCGCMDELLEMDSI